MSKIIIKLVIFFIATYKYLISPFLGNKCRYLPTCSEYFVESLKTHGLLKGLTLGIKRIFSCHPFKSLGGGSDFDFVPDQNQINRESKNG